MKPCFGSWIRSLGIKSDKGSSRSAWKGALNTKKNGAPEGAPFHCGGLNSYSVTSIDCSMLRPQALPLTDSEKEF